MEPALSARGLRKSFKLSAKQRKLERTDVRVKTAVDGLSFDVAFGEVYGLLGPNGAGKTTTLRMLAALVKPDEGDAFVEGASVVSDPMRVRSRVGFLTSELKLEDAFSPDYLFDFFSELRGVDASSRDERKRALFARFGIDRFAQTKVADLSTGMKQKASLAVSLVHDPRVHLRRAHERPRRAHGQDGDRLSAGAGRRGQDGAPVHPHLQPRGEGVRPRGRRHRRTHGGLGNVARGDGWALP